MEKRITATQAVRDFSELLNRINFKGTHYIIERNGKPVASMEPVIMRKKGTTLKELKFLLKDLPRLDDELAAFAADIENIRKCQPSLPKKDIWE
ncbi:MAG: type II toxin-antitoxin system Phd/YefM family antitoxin [Deltaproteobacteria bacterium]|nr:type II toxin-antitoxin system Phd/YefM family antitoxin [Deltaproteobacteria bacterium]